MADQTTTSVAAPRSVDFSRGLEDVIAGVSSITDVRGQEGRLLYRGYDVRDLARCSTFEETTYLLWNGELPTGEQLDSLVDDLRHSRDLPQPVWNFLLALPPEAKMMDALRAAVTYLGLFSSDAGDTSKEANRRQAISLTARMPTLVAAIARLREGKEVVPPAGYDCTAAEFLYMYFGRDPEDYLVRALDEVLILHADHEFNASTFAGRITASTLADMHCVLATCLATLEGPLHGGANEEVMAMLEEIGRPERAEAYVLDRLAHKQKIMGFGHRVYKTEDPRATNLRRMSKELGERTADTCWYEISRRVEDVVKREKGLAPNVDFFSASVYHAMGIPCALYTPMFAISRVAGYTAHAMEQYADNRLIRPRAFYIGRGEREYVPLGGR